MSIFYESKVNIITSSNYRECFTEKGMELLKQIKNNPDDVCRYVYSVSPHDRSKYNIIFQELCEMKKYGILLFETADGQSTSLDLNIIFPIRFTESFMNILNEMNEDWSHDT